VDSLDDVAGASASAAHPTRASELAARRANKLLFLIFNSFVAL